MGYVVVALLLLVIVGIVIGLQTAGLALTLFLFSGDQDSPFTTDGKAKTWARCAALVTVTLVLSLIPFLGCIASPVVWILGLMAFFQASLLRAILISVVNAFVTLYLGMGAQWLLGMLLGSFGSAP